MLCLKKFKYGRKVYEIHIFELHMKELIGGFHCHAIKIKNRKPFNE